MTLACICLVCMCICLTVYCDKMCNFSFIWFLVFWWLCMWNVVWSSVKMWFFFLSPNFLVVECEIHWMFFVLWEVLFMGCCLIALKVSSLMVESENFELVGIFQLCMRHCMSLSLSPPLLWNLKNWQWVGVTPNIFFFYGFMRSVANLTNSKMLFLKQLLKCYRAI